VSVPLAIFTRSVSVPLAIFTRSVSVPLAIFTRSVSVPLAIFTGDADGSSAVKAILFLGLFLGSFLVFLD